MRGRKPRPLEVVSTDVPLLQAIARSRARPWLQVQRARIVLAVAAGQRIQSVAAQLQCDPATVWRGCRRYEAVGLELLLAEQPRSGHPQQISPPAAGAGG